MVGVVKLKASYVMERGSLAARTDHHQSSSSTSSLSAALVSSPLPACTSSLGRTGGFPSTVCNTLATAPPSSLQSFVYEGDKTYAVLGDANCRSIATSSSSSSAAAAAAATASDKLHQAPCSFQTINSNDVRLVRHFLCLRVCLSVPSPSPLRYSGGVRSKSRRWLFGSFCRSILGAMAL